MISLEFLDKVEAFKNLSDDQLEAIAKIADVADYKRNDLVFKQGQDSEYLWIVMEGEIDLRQDLATGGVSAADNISLISEAQTFGWSCFVPPNKYRLSGYCSSRSCKVVRFKKEDLIDIFEKDYVIGYTIMSYLVRVVSEHFHKFQDNLARHRGFNIMANW